MEHLINLNFAPGGLPATIHVSQYDDTIRQLRFQLWFGRSKVEVPSGASVRVDILKPDGHIVLVNGTVNSSDRSIVTVPTTKQMTAVPGGSRGTLVVSSTGDKRISSAIFILQVHRDPVEDGDASDSDLSMLQDAIDQTAANALAAQAAATAAQQAAESFTVDSTLDSTSTNAIQNKAVAEGFEAINESLGNIANLDTSVKTSIVDAINAAQAEIDDAKTDLGSLVMIGTSFANGSLIIENPVAKRKNEDFRRGAGISVTGRYPFYGTNERRIAYTDFDIRLSYGKRYRVVVDVPEEYASTAQMGVHIYDSYVAAAYENEDETFDPEPHIVDLGWSALSTTVYIGKTGYGENGIGIRLVVRPSTENPLISDDFVIKKLRIYELPDSEFPEGSDSEYVYEKSNSDFTKTRFVFGTSSAHPFTTVSNRHKTYTRYDLRLATGASYLIQATVPVAYESTATMLVIPYDTSLINAYNNGTTPFDVNAHTKANAGWSGLTQNILLNNTNAGEPCVGVLISVAQSSEFPVLSDDFTVSVTIKEIGAKEIEPDTGMRISKLIADGNMYKIDPHSLDKYYPAKWDTTKFFNAVTISNPMIEFMAHTSNVFDGEDGYLYVTYYANHNLNYEHISADIISKIVKINQCDLHDFTIVETLRKGQDFGNFIQSTDYAPYDQLLIPKSDNVFSYVFVATPQDGVPTVATIDFDKSEMQTDGNATLSNFKYKIGNTTNTVIMNTTNIDAFINSLLGTTGKTIGLYPILTKAVPYNGAYYTILGGLQAQSADNGFAGCIIKTADLGKTWEYVAYNPAFTNLITCMWEGSLDITPDGKAICLLRAVTHGEPFGTGYYQTAIAVKYDIATKVWGEYKTLTGLIGQNIADDKNGIFYNDAIGGYRAINVDDSRPFVFIDGENVYLIQNITPKMSTIWKTGGVSRSTIQIWKCDKDLNIVDFKRLRNDSGIHYFSIVNARGRKYMCFSEDRRHLFNDCKGNIAIMPVDFLD